MIILVRHGETAGNAERRLQVPDTPLSERGLAQAQRLARRLAGEGVGRILSSDYARARMTAAAVAATTQIAIELDAGLRERNFGELRGRRYADLEVDPFAPGYTPPGGESWDDLHARVDAVWERVRAACAETSGALVVVTHGLVCHSLAERHLSVPEGERWVGGFHNTSVTEIQPVPPWRVERLNCTAHLDDQTAHDVGTRSGL